MKRTWIKATAVATGLAMVLAACSSGDSEAETDGPVTLTVSVWNYENTPEFKALFDAFEAANTDITIEPVDILADDYAEKVTTMLAGGDTTDVLTMKNVTDYSRYAGRGQLADLTELVEGLDAESTAGLDAFNLEDEYFAVPYRQDFWLLYYNKGMFDAAGLDYPENLTWDEYADLAKELSGTVDGQQVYGTYQHVWRSVIQAVAAAQTGSDLIGGEYDFFTDQYEMSLDLQEAGATLDWATATAQQTGYRTMFETGATAMMPMGSWYIAGILQAVKDGNSTVDWGISQMPQITSGGDTVTFGSPTAFAVNKNAKHTEAAKKFIEFAAGEEGATAIATIGVVPAFSSEAITETYFGIEGLPTDDVSKDAFVPDEVVLEMPVSDYASDIDTILTEEHSLIMVGEKSVADGIAQMNKRVTSEVLD